MKFSQCIREEQSRAEVCNLSVNLSREKSKFKGLRARRVIQSWIAWIVYPSKYARKAGFHCEGNEKWDQGNYVRERASGS